MTNMRGNCLYYIKLSFNKGVGFQQENRKNCACVEV